MYKQILFFYLIIYKLIMILSKFIRFANLNKEINPKSNKVTKKHFAKYFTQRKFR